MCHLTIEGEPVAKGRPRFSTCGSFVKTYTPQKTKDFEELVGTIARFKIKNPFVNNEALKLTIAFYMPIPKSLSEKKRLALDNTWHKKKPDVDNLVKAICDSLNGIAWEDDSQVAKIEAWKLYSFEPRTEIWINELED